MSQGRQRFKVVLLGEGRVGKTSILLRYVRNEYSETQVRPRRRRTRPKAAPRGR